VLSKSANAELGEDKEGEGQIAHFPWPKKGTTISANYLAKAEFYNPPA
jgi:hypothetical protein